MCIHVKHTQQQGTLKVVEYTLHVLNEGWGKKEIDQEWNNGSTSLINSIESTCLRCMPSLPRTPKSNILPPHKDQPKLQETLASRTCSYICQGLLLQANLVLWSPYLMMYIV